MTPNRERNIAVLAIGLAWASICSGPALAGAQTVVTLLGTGGPELTPEGVAGGFAPGLEVGGEEELLHHAV